MMESRFEHGEQIAVLERMIIAPAVGTFAPRDGDADGMMIERGDTIGEVHGPGTTTLVTSPFRGVIQGVLSQPGERLRRGQPVAWLRVA
jgi:biotin carboxyl carrier protein